MKIPLTAILLLATSLSASAKIDYPPSPKQPQTFSYHTQKIHDPYTYLEDTQSQQTDNWAKAQNQLSETWLSQSSLKQTEQRILQYSNFQSYRAFNRIGDTLFYLKGWSGTTTAALFTESGNAEKVKRIAGPDISKKIPDGKQNTLVSYFWPSPDGQYVVVMLNKMGDRWGELQLIEVATAKVLKRFKKGGFIGMSQVSWGYQSKHFAMSLFSQDRQQSPEKVKVVSYTLSSQKTQLIYQPKLSKQLTLTPVMLQGSNKLVIHQRKGSATTNRIALLDIDKSNQAPQWLFNNDNANRLFLGNKGDRLWFYTDEDAANGQVISINLRHPDTTQVIIKQSKKPISANSSVGGNAIGMFGNTIALTYLDGGRYIVRGFDLSGKAKYTFDVPDSGSIWGGFNGSPDNDRFYFGFLGVAEPSSIYEVDGKGKRRLVKSPELPFDMQITTRRVYVQSALGVKVPVLVAHRKGLDLSLPKPTILYGYGGFGWVSFMWYQAHLMEWFDRDGVYVVSGVRGGGEYGSQWHQAGIKHNRQNAIDDYIATSRWLIDNGITKPNMLIANGGSFSGSLIAAAVLQQPKLFGMALIDFPILDMLRYNQFGHAKYWQSELGDPKVKADFNALMAYSPYHQLIKGQCLPATLIRTGQFDTTTTPMHGYKFVAAAQQNKNCKQPVLLDVMEGAGHNFGATPEQISRSHALALTFISKALFPSAE